MSEDTTSSSGGIRLPASRHELWALLLAVAVVFVLVQVGAPIIRSFDFLDPKLRDYFIGMSFAAFPLIHRNCKQQLMRMRGSHEPILHDSPAWYVTGIIAGAILFAWNQFVSALAGLSHMTLIGAYPDPTSLNLSLEELAGVQTLAALLIILPISAVASVFAGIQINRHTRSHVFGAIAIAALFFVVANTTVTFAMHSDMVIQIFSIVLSGTAEGIQVLFGMCLVGFIVFGFGALGVMISRYYRERPLGQIIEAARKLSADDRASLANELTQRMREAQKPMAPAPAPVQPSPPQMPSAAEP